MTDPVKISLTPDTEAYLKSLASQPARVRSGILRAIDQVDQLVVGHIDEDHLSSRGPDTLGVITNRLRGSIRATKAELVPGGYIRATIGSNVAYAGYHEYGFHGVEQVKAFVRTIVERAAKPPGARINKKTGKIIEKKGKILNAYQVTVKAHTRNVDYAGRAFIRPSIVDYRATYRLYLARAITAAIVNQGENN
jgi:hypothetical protein